MEINDLQITYVGNQQLAQAFFSKFSHSRHIRDGIFGLYLLSPHFKERPHRDILPYFIGIATSGPANPKGIESISPGLRGKRATLGENKEK